MTTDFNFRLTPASDFGRWRRSTEALLRSKDLWKYVEGPSTTLNVGSNYGDRAEDGPDHEARFIIEQSVSDEVYRILFKDRQTQTASDSWGVIIERFSHNVLAVRTDLKAQLYDLKLSQTDNSVKECIAKMDQIIGRLRDNCQVIVHDHEAIDLLFHKLPKTPQWVERTRPLIDKQVPEDNWLSIKAQVIAVEDTLLSIAATARRARLQDLNWFKPLGHIVAGAQSGFTMLDHIVEDVLGHLTFFDIVALAMTSHSWHKCLQTYTRKEVVRALKPHFRDVNAFLRILSFREAVISGSFALRLMMRESWTAADLDIYVPYSKSTPPLVSDLKSRCGFKIRSRSEMYGSDEDPESGMHVIVPLSVFKMEDANGTAIDVIAPQESGVTPVDMIKCFHSTPVMGGISATGFFHLWPGLTCARKALMAGHMKLHPMRPRDIAAIRKYKKRGYTYEGYTTGKQSQPLNFAFSSRLGSEI